MVEGQGRMILRIAILVGILVVHHVTMGLILFRLLVQSQRQMDKMKATEE